MSKKAYSNKSRRSEDKLAECLADKSYCCRKWFGLSCHATKPIYHEPAKFPSFYFRRVPIAGKGPCLRIWIMWYALCLSDYLLHIFTIDSNLFQNEFQVGFSP